MDELMDVAIVTDALSFVIMWGVYFAHYTGRLPFESAVLLCLILIWVRIGAWYGD